MASTVRKPNLLTKSQGDGKVVHFHIFRKKRDFLRKPQEIVDFSQIPWESNSLGWYNDDDNGESGGQRGVKVMSSSIASVGTQG